MKAHQKVHPTTCLLQALLNLVLETKKKERLKKKEKERHTVSPETFPAEPLSAV